MSIQKIHRYFSNPLAIIPLCLMILFVTTSANALPTATATDYSAEDLFRGIYFAQGPVANQIPAIKSFNVNRFIKDADRISEVRDFQDRVMAKVQRNHPDFLEELKASVNSRNNYTIKATLIRGNEIVTSISSGLAGNERDIAKEEEFKTELSKRVDLNRASGEEISAAVESMAADVLIITDIWVLTPVCMFAFCWVVLYIGNMEMHPEGLFQEELVNDISKL